MGISTALAEPASWDSFEAGGLPVLGSQPPCPRRSCALAGNFPQWLGWLLGPGQGARWGCLLSQRADLTWGSLAWPLSGLQGLPLGRFVEPSALTGACLSALPGRWPRA